MSGYRVPLRVLLTISLLSCPLARAQDTDLEVAREYSTKLQQFLLQKIKEAETWDEYDEFEDLVQAKKGRQNYKEDDDEQSEIIDEDIEEGSGDDEGSGEEEGSGEVTVLNSAPFRMSSQESDLTTEIELQEVSGSDLLTMVCRVAVREGSDILSNSSCLPQIYLVSGEPDCNTLSQVGFKAYYLILSK